MVRKWTVNAEDEVHSITYRRNIFGFARISIDEDEFPLGHVGCRQRSEQFRVGDSPCMLTLKGRHVEIFSRECEVVKQ